MSDLPRSFAYIDRMKKDILVLALLLTGLHAEPIYFAFHWHMHQPNYYPGETIVETESAGHHDYSVVGIHTDRTGPYTTWVNDALQAGAGLEHLGAQVSLSGSLIENLNELDAANVAFNNWTTSWNDALALTTTGGNPRLDLVAFGYFHPLMALIPDESIGDQIDRHRALLVEQFPAYTPSHGIFPPENAFSLPMIPALVAEDLEWVLVDNIHFERAVQGYPYSTGSNLVAPNPAEQINTDPGDWQNLNGLWCPSQISARWAHQPHYAEYIDPESGASSRIIVVPASRYIGNEDGRGGFGALQYETVMSQLEAVNTDPDHPILVVMAHDGDNHGGGSDSYYHSNFQAMVSWLQSQPDRFVCTTIQDYLDQFPPDLDDVIHVEPGSWSGADNGDPEFLKWNGDPNAQGYSPDRTSWAVMTAAHNLVRTAADYAPGAAELETAERYLYMGQGSDYWYWDWAQGGLWDTHPTRAANLAIEAIQSLLGTAPETVPPSIYLPQREPYNPGGDEWGTAQARDFTIWTLVHDWSDPPQVTLKVREDSDGLNDPATSDNELYAGGPDVGEWVELPMSAVVIEPQTSLEPHALADLWAVEVTGYSDVLLDYHVEAVDPWGNVARSVIQHVYVGSQGGSGGDPFSMDGVLDESADLLAASATLDLYWTQSAGELYLATHGATVLGDDAFIVLATEPGDLQPTFWAKSGQVAAWDAFLGNESSNNWSGWFDTDHGSGNAAGTVLEGVFQWAAAFPDRDTLYVAAVRYTTEDGGILNGQVPVGNGDINLDAAEFALIVRDPVSRDSHVAVPASLHCSVFPNPANGAQVLRIESPFAGGANIRLHDLRGRLLWEGETILKAGRHNHDLGIVQELPSGIYLVRIQVGEQIVLQRFTRLN